MKLHKTVPRRGTERSNELDNRFRDGLIRERTARKISYAEMGRRTGLPDWVVKDIEGRGDKLPRSVTVGEAIVIAQALGVTPKELLS